MNNILSICNCTNDEVLLKHDDPRLDKLYKLLIKDKGFDLVSNDDIALYKDNKEISRIKLMKNHMRVIFTEFECNFNISEKNSPRTLKLFESLLNGYVNDRDLEEELEEDQDV